MQDLTTVLGDIFGVVILIVLVLALFVRVALGPEYKKHVVARRGFHKYYTREKLRD
jgi:hypothetical protein